MATTDLKLVINFIKSQARMSSTVFVEPIYKRFGDQSVPFSTVSAVGPLTDSSLGPFTLTDGRPVPALADDEVLLNAWTAITLASRKKTTWNMTSEM